MSTKPSVLDTLKDTASTAARTVSDAVKPAEPNYDPNKDKTNFTKDVHGNTMRKGDYKDQLSEAAMGGGPPRKEDGVFEKGTWISFVPCRA
jgi:hypothetical protein